MKINLFFKRNLPLMTLMASLTIAPIKLFALEDKGLSGLEVMQKVDRAQSDYVGSLSVMKLILINAHGDKLERIMETKLIEIDDKSERSMIEFQRPRDVRGVKLLTWTVQDDDNKQWLYLPRFKKTKKITSSAQSGSFMGSEFSYEDIAGTQISKYNYKILSDGKDFWEIESTPKKESGYSKIISKVSKPYLHLINAKYFDRKGELLKTSELKDFETYTVKGKKITLAKYIMMQNVQTRKSSVIEWVNRKLGENYQKIMFSPIKLK